MSENTAGTCLVCGTYHPTSLACPNASLAYMRAKEPDATVSALDALRSAVVAQTALLRSLSEQVRIGSEAHYAILKVNQTLLQAIDAVGDANRLECQTSFAALAERLGGIERKLGLIPGIVAIVSEGKDLLSNRLTQQSQQLVLLQSWVQDIEAKLDEHLTEIGTLVGRAMHQIPSKPARRKDKAKR